MPSRDFTSEDLFSSRMMSMHSSTHSSQMKTVGPAISFRTSCWLFPQKEQYRVFLESPPLLPLTLLISLSFQHSARSINQGHGHLPSGGTCQKSCASLPQRYSTDSHRHY